MRPRGRDDDDDSSPPAPVPSPRPPRAPLCSLVVKLPRENGGGGSVDAAAPDGGASSPAPEADVDEEVARRRDSPPSRRRRVLSPPDPRRRERRRSPPPPARRRGSPPPARRRATPPGLQPRYPRFHEEQQGYGMHAGSVSPVRRRRLENNSFDDAVGPRCAHGHPGGGRGGGRLRHLSPQYGRGRSYGRGYNAPGKELTTIDGEYVHRNDPNLSPREGDWICQNPNCGNLNFARRTHCNNCNKYRFAPEVYESSRSPRRGYINSPLRGSPGRILGPPCDRGLPREMTRYRSPPHGWDVDDPRDYAARSPPGRVRRFADPVRRDRMDFRGELEFRDHGKFEWSATEDYDHRERPRDAFYLDRRRRSLSPRANWSRGLRGRSRSPAGDRPLKSSFIGRGRGNRDYAGPYVGRARHRDLDVGRGRGYRQGDDPFPGRGRGNRRVVPRGRDGEVFMN